MDRLPSKINLNRREKWKGILEDVDKDEVPVEVMERVTVNLIDGSTVDINIRQLISKGENPFEVQRELQNKLNQLDQYIEDVDFHINIDAVANTIQPVTDKILKNL